MQENQFVRLNIAFKLPREVAEKVINLSQELSNNHKAYFVFDGKTILPHITIYSPEYPAVNYDKVLNGVKDLTNEFGNIKLTYDKIINTEGFIGVKFVLSPEIIEMHEKIIAKFNPLRESHYKKKYDTPAYKMKISAQKEENINNYGYPDVMSLYNPHLTIIRLEDKIKADELANELNWGLDSFTADTIAVYKMAEHGTCIESVLEIKI